MNTCADMGGSANAGLESASPMTKAMAVLPDANIRHLAAQCFTRGGEPLKLAKPKAQLSYDSDALQSILRP